jgi:DNA polymerase-1
MTAADLLGRLRAARVELAARGDRLHYRAPPGVLTPHLLEGMREHKDGLLELLAPADHTADHHQQHQHVDAHHQLPVAYRYVTDVGGLAEVLAALATAEVVALDIETSGLCPRSDRVRLLSLALDPDRPVFLIDCFAVDPAPVLEVLAGKELIGHNLQFDLSFLAGLGLVPGKVCCTMLLSQLLDGTRRPRGFHTLAEVVRRELGQELPKALQASDWSVPALSAGQLAYAARDAAVLLPLCDRLMARVRDASMAGVAVIEARCLPAMVWLSTSGAPFDRARWEGLAAGAGREAKWLARQLAEQAPPRPGGQAWNWNSPKQVKDALALAGVTLDATDDSALAAAGHPLAALLRAYRTAAKLASTYGVDWIKDAYHQGRLYTNWRQVGCITGRMSSAAPNLQNLPGDPRYRACFRAPEGRVLIRADYSQIELRIAAKVTGDRRMLDAYFKGEDLHRLTAQRLTGKDEVTAQERKLAKPVNFGLIYGLSSSSLRKKAKAEYNLDLTAEDAERYRGAFFRTYRGVGAWHARLRAESTPEVRTLAGRRCPLPEKHFYGTRANYCVQGSGGDGLKLALALLWERRDQCPGAFPVLAVHDELVIEAGLDQAEAAAAWLRRAMLDAMAPLLDPVPVGDVEPVIARNWAGDPPAPVPDVVVEVAAPAALTLVAPPPPPPAMPAAPTPAAPACSHPVPPAGRYEPDVRLGDHREVLTDVHAQLIVTSPPYNIGSKAPRCDGMRKYGKYDRKSFGAIRDYPDDMPEPDYQDSQEGFPALVRRPPP